MLRRSFTAVMSAILLCSSVVSPFSAYAENAMDLSGSGLNTITEESGESTDIRGESVDLDVVPNGAEEENIGGSPAELDFEAEEDSLTFESEGKTVSSSEVLEYVYVDQSVISLGEVQYIALSFNTEFEELCAASIELTGEDGSALLVEASGIAGHAALFEIEFDSPSSALAYTITRADFESANDSVTVDFSKANSEGQAYTFDVVTEETADVLKSGSEDGVSTILIDENGQLEAVDSLEKALTMVDSEGVRESQEEAASPEITSPKARAAVTKTRESYLVVAIDPGHGGNDPGSMANGLRESDVNWSIANHFKNELSTYTGVTPYLTTNGDEIGLQARVDRAANVGADVFVSVHVNASLANSANGCEVWVPNNSAYNNGTHTVGQQLGQKIENELASLGLNRRGVFTKNHPAGEGDSRYPDGSASDYYSVIRNARKRNIPAIIVEHAFITNGSDASKLSQDSFRKKLGIADANGVASQYNLGKDSAARSVSSVAVKAHIAELGWESTVYDKKVAGSTGDGLDLQAFQISTMNAVGKDGGITYRADVSGSWQDWKSNGQTAGTTGQNKAVQGIQVKLTGNAANKYDVYYRVHVANMGWLGWAKNGASAGSSGYGYGAQAIELVIVNKGGAAPGSTKEPYRVKNSSSGNIAGSTGGSPTVSYRAHVQNIGWQGWTSSLAGTIGRALQVEALQVKVDGKGISGSIETRAHVQNIGWQGWKASGDTAGTSGKNLRVEAIQLRLTGELAARYDVYYRVHAAEFGWLGWAKNGAKAGSSGYGRAVESVEVRLVKKGAAAPGSTANPYHAPAITYQAHVQNIGWQSSVSDGVQAGTTGRALGMEAVKVSLGPAVESGAVQVQAHVQNIGWMNYAGGVAGTTGRNLPIEALRIKLTGKAAEQFDVYYRVHSAEFGWFGWTMNDAPAGSEGYARAVQAIQIKLVPKGGKAPGSTATPFRNKNDEPIMGSSKVSASALARRYRASGASYPSNVYKAKGAATIDDYCKIVAEEAKAEGVRAEVVFAQAMHETGWLKFGGSVKPEQCNFAGLGATSSTAGGASFESVRIGVRAQVQHLKAYASTAKLSKPCVDPRFNLVKRGSAAMLFDLNGKWAVPGLNYGQSILSIMKSI